jgi:hypothetical protein
LVAVGALGVGVTAALLVRPDTTGMPEDPLTSAALALTEVELL